MRCGDLAFLRRQPHTPLPVLWWLQQWESTVSELRMSVPGPCLSDDDLGEVPPWTPQQGSTPLAFGSSVTLHLPYSDGLHG